MKPGGLLLLAGGLCGAAGVALAAAAAHAGGGNVGTASTFLMLHAPLFVAVGLLGCSRALAAAAGVILLGVLLFSGDLLMRHQVGTRLFPMAAPTGGFLMIGGWMALGGLERRAPFVNRGFP